MPLKIVKNREGNPLNLHLFYPTLSLENKLKQSLKFVLKLLRYAYVKDNAK
jgi:hypothetical protein